MQYSRFSRILIILAILITLTFAITALTNISISKNIIGDGKYILYFAGWMERGTRMYLSGDCTSFHSASDLHFVCIKLNSYYLQFPWRRLFNLKFNMYKIDILIYTSKKILIDQECLINFTRYTSFFWFVK